MSEPSEMVAAGRSNRVSLLQDSILWGTLLRHLFAEAWASLHQLWRAVYPARVSLGAVLVAGCALLFLPQGQDMYIEIAENEGAWRWLGLQLGVLVLSLIAWWQGRFAFTKAEDAGTSYDEVMSRRHASRGIGFLLHVLVVAGLIRAATADWGWWSLLPWAFLGLATWFLLKTVPTPQK